MNAVIALKKAKAYTDESILGGGAIVGKNVQVAKIEPIIGGNRITFQYTLDDGTSKTTSMNVMNGEQGVSIIDAKVNNENLLTFTLSNGATITAGTIAIDLSGLNFDDYYTKEQSDNNYVKEVELNSLVEQRIDKYIDSISPDEIKGLFN